MGKKKNKGKNKMEEVLNEEVLNKEDEASEADGTNEEAKDAVEETAETEASVETEEEAGEDATEESDPKQSRIEELEDKVKRQLAEFDNFRKRTDKEKETMFEAGAKSVIEKLLPVVDNFERGLASIPEEEQGSAHAEGMMMIYKQLMGELEKLDVKPIEAVGKEFNPELHNAVMQCESDEYESGIVAQELQKGYTYRDSVIRHSMVAVVS
ncbi:MAG: nucleotide exchange factor GrpE [Lachnospiraceae bacterium]|jgi:Molecular chaperone GrpE (heat shock protein)|nr:nucleotide exchange factor GrpE [Lachnospiraceae bacterium]